MSNWNNLSMQERAEVMKLAIDSGIYDLDTIRGAYNEFAEGGKKESWTMKDEADYRTWRSSLPANLRNTNDNDYDMRGAFKAGMQPTLESDGYYHLQSRDPRTGRILKSPHHPTYLQAINTDARLGYYPVVDRDGNTYTQTWEGNRYSDGGSIHIKPSHRGRLTELKERTGKSEAELYNDGNPAHKKMVVFARNARKWKHEDGGNLFDDGGDKDNIFKYTNSNGDVRYVYQDSPDAEEVPVRPLNTIFPDPAQWTFTDDAGKFYTPKRTTPTNTAELNPDNRTGFERALDNYIGEAFNTVPKGYHTLPAIGAAAFGLANPALGEAALTSGFGAHGLSKWINGEINGPLDAAMTALEVTPLGRLAKPIAKEAIDAGKTAYNELYTPWKVSSTMNRSLDSNPIIRTYESNPVYGDIGTLLNYQDYIQSMFPNSKIKDVAFHTTASKPFEAFDPTKVKRGFGFYFSPSEHKLPFNRTVYARINMENPLVVNTTTNRGLSVDGLAGDIEGTKAALKENNYDGIFGVTNMRNPGEPEIVVLNPRQIHILGSNHDLAGFRRASSSLSPQITSENAASIAPEQWTAAQDAAIARGGMAEVQEVEPFRFTGYKESPFQMHLKRAKAKGYDVSDIKVIDLTKDSPERTEYINNSGLVGSFEEKLQMLIDRINKGGGAGNPKGTKYILHTNPDNLDAKLSHELNHLLQIPDEPVPKGTVYGGWMNIFGDYFKRFNNTDIAARLSQIRDYYGQTGKEPLTESMLKYAREHYEEDTGVKNKVQEMLWNTGDLKGLAEWGNKYATGLIPFGFIGPYYLNNE